MKLLSLQSTYFRMSVSLSAVFLYPIVSVLSFHCNNSHHCQLVVYEVHRSLMAELQRNEAELHIAGCSLRINSDLVQESALLLKPSGPVDGHHFFLPIPKSDELRFKPGQDLLLACPGKRNSIVIKGQPETYNKEITAITAFCYSGRLQ